jgi:hypothetical protein
LEKQRLVQVSRTNKLAGIAQDLVYIENKNYYLPEEDKFAQLLELYQEYYNMALKAESNKLSPY